MKNIKYQKSKIKITLLLIIFFAAILRLWRLDKYPSGLNADEAAIGYNAYSLIATGKDEHGQTWPLHFKSFGDYKPGLYFYLVLPFVKILGLNIWSVRLPSAILGILGVFILYLLVKELFKNEKLALLGAFFLAISPWHLHFSRGGWEVNAASFLVLLGIYFFFKAFNKPKLFVVSCLFLVLSMYTYHGPRLIIPVFGLGLLIFYRREIFQKRNFKWLVYSMLLAILLLMPLVLSFFGPALSSRFSGVGLLADTGPLWRMNELRGQHPETMAWNVRLLHNRFSAYLVAFLENYFDHFNGGFLFLYGDEIARSRVPGMGQMYLFDILGVILGIYFLLLSKESHRKIVFLWLAVAPLAAALTFQTPHALRAHNMVFPLVIISAYGIYHLLSWLKEFSSKIVFFVVSFMLLVVMLWNFSYYLHQYYVHYPKVYPYAWEEGFAELASYIKRVEDKYQKIYVTDKYDQPYILFLFYLKYPPEKFQQEVKLTPRDKFGFSTVQHFDKFYFQKINLEELSSESKVLIVGAPSEIPKETKKIKIIWFSNNEPAFEVIER